MTSESLISIVREKWGGILLAGLLAGSLAFFALVFFSKHFKVTTDFLVVQTGASQSQDFYAMLKSSEYLGKVLSESVQSEKFIGAVVETGGVDGNFLPSNPKDRLEAWEKMVQVTNNPDVGTLHIEVYGNDDRVALRVAQAVGKVMTERNSLFRSGDEKSVEIRTLSGPIVEKNPGMERMILSAIAGFFFGISIFLLLVLMQAEQKVRAIFLAHNSLTRTLARDIHGKVSIPSTFGALPSKSGAVENNIENKENTEKPGNERSVAGSAPQRVYTDSRLAFDEE